MKITPQGKTPVRTRLALALLMAGGLAAGPALADRDDDRDHGGHGRKEWRKDRHDDEREDRSGRRDGRHSHFDDRQRIIIHDYYVERFRDDCPPGLAKKRNGCLPPGQARKWHVGRPLPAGVIYYDVPPPLVVQIGAPPPGYRYVRVATDILLIAVGTGLVVDAIEDLGRVR